MYSKLLIGIVLMILFDVMVDSAILHSKTTSEVTAEFRRKRDVFEDMKSGAMLGAGELMSRAQQGVALKDNRDTKMSIFGYDIGGGYGHKIGFGDSLNDE